MAKIIQLVPRHHGPLCPMGFRFPGVYRCTGFSFADVELGTADRRYPYIGYSLVDDVEAGGTQIAEPVFTPITHLDPALDDGWLLIKRHTSPEIADAYWEGQLDLADDGDLTSSVYQTPEGIFTLLHRAPRPRCENHLLIFTTFDPGFRPAHRPDWIPAGDYWTHIIRATGELAPAGLYGSDDGFLWPDDD